MRPSVRYLTAAVSMLALAACADTTAPNSSPTQQLSPSSPAFNYGRIDHPRGQRSTTFTIDSNAKHVNVNGLFSLDIPDNVCPKLSGSLSCEGSVTVKAVTRLTSAGAVVDFSPHLTFDKPVKLSTDIFSGLIRLHKRHFAAHPSSLSALAMYYSPSLTAAPVADFEADRSLITHVNLKTGTIWRSVWHFSGYLMGGGEACDPADGNPNCIEVDGK